MKKWIIFLLLPLCFKAKAQNQTDDNEIKKVGFQKEKLFTGGSANLGFATGSTMLGIAPQLGYSFTNWLDAGININVNYISQRDYISENKLRQTIYGPGAFVRLFPVNFLFASAQFEHNFIHEKYITQTLPSQEGTLNANSFLIGAGYAGGRQKGGNTYYYLSIMWDVSGDPNSPYVDQYGRSSPVIRAGYNIGLFQGKNRNNGGYR